MFVIQDKQMDSKEITFQKLSCLRFIKFLKFWHKFRS